MRAILALYLIAYSHTLRPKSHSKAIPSCCVVSYFFFLKHFIYLFHNLFFFCVCCVVVRLPSLI